MKEELQVKQTKALAMYLCYFLFIQASGLAAGSV